MTVAERARRAVLVLGGMAVALGFLGAVVAWSTGFSTSESRQVGWPQHELALATFNLAGALLTLSLGALAVAGALAGRRVLVLVAAGGFTLLALQVLVQAGRPGNWLGSGGSNLGLAVGVAAGLAVAEWARTAGPEDGTSP